MNTPSQFYKLYMAYMATQDQGVMALVTVTALILAVYIGMLRLRRAPLVGKAMSMAATVYPYPVLAAYAWLTFAAWSAL